MQNDMVAANKTTQYFQQLKQHQLKRNNLEGVLKQKQQLLTHQISEGQIKVDSHSEKLAEHDYNILLKNKDINPFESRYKGFLVNSDRSKSVQRFQLFKKIKEQYSYEKTASVVKQVQGKIKEWAEIKLHLDMKKKAQRQKQKQMEQEAKERLKEKQREEKEKEKQRKKNEIAKRIQMIEDRKQKRIQMLRDSSLKTLQAPKYIEIEKKFVQLQKNIKEQQQKILEEKRLSMKIKKEDILEHRKKYLENKKNKELQRIKSKSLKSLNSISIDNRQEFNIYLNQDSDKKKQERNKRQRRKQFIQKVKNSLLTKSKSSPQNGESVEIKKQQKSTEKQISKQEQSKSHKKKIKRKIDLSADPRKLGNDYLKQLRQKDKASLNRTIEKSETSKKIILPIISKTASYKNYLTEVKITRKKANDQIQQLKQRCKSKAEVFEILHAKSKGYEQNVLKKISELKKINKYDESVNKQSQIDELYTRFIKMRLACIEL